MGPVLSPLGIVITSNPCKSFPDHRRAALRALALETRNAALVRHFLPAARADAVAAGPGPSSTAHPPPAPAPCSSAASASLPHADPSIHDPVLLEQTAYASAMAPAAPQTTRHGECAPIKFAPAPSLDKLAQIAGHERDHPDAVRCYQSVEMPRDRAANQGIDSQLQKASHSLKRRQLTQELTTFAHDLPSTGFHDMELPGYVKNRRDPIAPCRKRCFWHPRSRMYPRSTPKHTACQNHARSSVHTGEVGICRAPRRQVL